MKVKIKSLNISRTDSISQISINGEPLEKVLDYRITSSADGNTELELKLDVSETFMIFGSSASQIEPTS